MNGGVIKSANTIICSFCATFIFQTSPSLYIRENLSSLGVKWNIAEQVMGKNDEEIIEYLTERILSHRIDYKPSSNANVWVEDAGNISDFLEGVMVHPSAPEWYVNIVQDICLQKGIHFDGQSQIYKLK